MQKFVSYWGVRLCAVALLFGTGSAAFSAEVGFNFTAQIAFVGVGSTSDYGGTYGIRLPDFSMFSGHFVYESNTPSYSIATEACVDCTAYHHKQINGLRVEFPGLTLQADEYIIQVQNDVNVSSVGEADVLTIWYPDQSNPSGTEIGKPLLVDGNPVLAGSYRMDLVAPKTTFSTSQLPTTLDPSVFMPSAGAGVFGDGLPYHYTLDVFFKPESVSAFPHSTSDHDLDGDVDGRDFLIWQRYAGESTGDGDADSNLLIDSNDLEMWQAEYGASANDLAVSVAVPEPATIALMLAACLIGIIMARTA